MNTHLIFKQNGEIGIYEKQNSISAKLIWTNGSNWSKLIKWSICDNYTELTKEQVEFYLLKQL